MTIFTSSSKYLIETVSDHHYVLADSQKCNTFLLMVVLKQSIVNLTKFKDKKKFNKHVLHTYALAHSHPNSHGNVIKDFLFMSFLVKELSQYEVHYIEILVLIAYITISRLNTVTKLWYLLILSKILSIKCWSFF